MIMEGVKEKNKRVVVVGTDLNVQFRCAYQADINYLSGAGVGGIATAARLAKAGLQVSVYEKNDFYGGKCSNIVHNGYVRFFKPPP
jgi:ribulose 1,5-bisphosphate synthetase/thiazole synthase